MKYYTVSFSQWTFWLGVFGLVCHLVFVVWDNDDNDDDTITTVKLKLSMMMVLPPVVLAAHSRRRIVARRDSSEPRYDRSITTFSSDGRLAQVEYGMEASLRGSTVAAINVQIPTKNNNSNINNNNNNQGICVVVENSSFGKVHRIDHHIWLITAGLSGDARVLAQTLRVSCQNHRLSLGEPPTTEQVARMAGQAQHELTRTAGARPLGCTAIVLGIDPSANNNEQQQQQQQPQVRGKPRLFQTDPGGIVEECSYCAAGRGRSIISKELSSLNVPNPLNNNNNKNAANDNLDLTIVARDLAETVLGKLEDPKGSRVDVWIIQPNNNRRGGLQATCYRNLDKESVLKLKSEE